MSKLDQTIIDQINRIIVKCSRDIELAEINVQSLIWQKEYMEQQIENNTKYIKALKQQVIDFEEMKKK